MHPEYFARIDYNASMYIRIAINAFYESSNIYSNLNKHDFSDGDIEEIEEFTKNITIAVVFSAMAIESFLNNYAATCLGDSEFYENFDKLSAIGKLQLISRFILKSPIDKGKACYYRTKKLFHERDAYVHNKSKDLNWKKIINIEKALDTPESLMEQATNAIKAIGDIAMYFDSIDPNVHAVSFLIDPQELFRKSEENTKAKKYVLEILKIKVEEYAIIGKS